jgi:CRISPR-associated exonuclease Cas4
MGWVLFLALALAALGVWLLLRSRTVQRDTGLPRGRVTYVDTGAWNRCERPLFSEQYRLTGRPDYLVQAQEGLVPVEVKSGAAPTAPYEAHVLQLAAYCLLIEEEEGEVPPYGIIKYEDRAFELAYTTALRNRLLDTLAALRQDLAAPEVDRSHEEPARCRACGYRARCEQRLV